MTRTLDILCFGDSITNAWAPQLQNLANKRYPELNARVINQGVNGDTTRTALDRLDQALDAKPDVVVVGFGMNDRGLSGADRVNEAAFAQNIEKIICAFEKQDVRIILLTINPVQNSSNSDIRAYNRIIRQSARRHALQLADVFEAWEKQFGDSEGGRLDGTHPDAAGNELICETILPYLRRHSIIILWQYNGNPCHCNYSCPYCQYPTCDQKGHYFNGPIEKWHEAFKRTFQNRHIVFYCAHGEPTIGKAWRDVIEMIGNEPDWELHITSNLSTIPKHMLESRVVKEGRLNVNGSFHPTETTLEKFLERLKTYRRHGIEVPVVYTLYPPFFERFESDFKAFQENRFLVHVRRFRGSFEGRTYPESYSEEQRRFLARHMDDATITYTLSNEPTDGCLTWTGVDFCLVDNQGNVGYCDDYRTDRFSFGNIFKGDVQLLQAPHPFPEGRVSDGTVDGVANLVALDYPQLKGNHIEHFSRLGGVYREDDHFVYGNLDKDFDDPAIRAEYNFPARNIRDAIDVLTHSDTLFTRRLRRLAYAADPQTFAYRHRITTGYLKGVATDRLRGLARRVRDRLRRGRSQ